MGYSKANIQYQGSVSGVVTTSGANEVITMQDGAANNVTVGALAISCTDALTLKINGESNVHTFAAGDKFNFENVAIDQIVIVESGVTIDYKGLYI